MQFCIVEYLTSYQVRGPIYSVYVYPFKQRNCRKSFFLRQEVARSELPSNFKVKHQQINSCLKKSWHEAYSNTGPLKTKREIIFYLFILLQLFFFYTQGLFNRFCFECEYSDYPKSELRQNLNFGQFRFWHVQISNAWALRFIKNTVHMSENRTQRFWKFGL